MRIFWWIFLWKSWFY